MPFLGTLVNFSAALLAGLLGLLIKKGVPERVADTVLKSMAIAVVYIGISGALEAAPTVASDAFLSHDLRKALIMILSLGIGSLIGEVCNIEGALERLGNFLERKLSRGEEKGQLAKGFVSCSMLICVGAMSVTGAIADATGNPDILFAKAVIDGVACFALASTMGIGAALAAFTVLIYQGAITLLTLVSSELLTGALLSYISATGSLVVCLVGTNVLGATKVRTANMIPAIFMPILLEPLFRLIFG